MGINPDTSQSSHPEINVGSAVAAVSFDKTESYYQYEINNEGALRSDVTQIVLLPANQKGEATKKWTSDVFRKMNKIRETQFPELMQFNAEYVVDVGLIDIQVFFDGDHDAIYSILRETPQVILQENLKHFDLIAGSVIHDQMTIVTTLHSLTPSGDFRLHYHNIIFSLRQENELYGPLSMPPIITALSQENRSINVV